MKKDTKTNARFANKKAEVKHFSQTNIAMWIFIFKKYSGFNGKNQEKMGKIENVVKSQQKSHANKREVTQTKFDYKKLHFYY